MPARVPAPWADAGDADARTYVEQLRDAYKPKDPEVDQLQQVAPGIPDSAFVSPRDLVSQSNPGSDVRREAAAADPSLKPFQRDAVASGYAAPDGKGIPGARALPPAGPDLPPGAHVETDTDGVQRTYWDPGDPRAPKTGNGPIMARPAGAPQSYGTLGGGNGFRSPAGPPPNKWLDALNRAYGDESAAVQAGAKAEKTADADTAYAEQRRANTIGNYRADDVKRQGQQDSDLLMQQRAIDETSRHLEKAAPDPDHWWHSQDTGDKIRYTLAAIFGGIAAGFNKGPNHALQHIEGLVDRDIHAQQAKIDSERGRLADQKGALAETYKRFGLTEESKARAKAALLEQIGAEGQAQAAQSRDPAVQARADQLSAQIRQKNAEVMFNATRPRPGAATGLPKGGMVVPLGGGRGIIAKSEHEAEALRGKLGAKDAIVGNLTQLRDLEKSATAADIANPWSDYNQKRTQLIEDTLTKKTVFEGQGAMSKDDAAHAEAAVGALSGMARFAGNPQAAVDRAIQNITRSTDAQVRAQGGMVVQQATGIDPATGMPAQHWLPTGESYDAQPNGGAPAGLPSGTAPVSGGR